MLPAVASASVLPVFLMAGVEAGLAPLAASSGAGGGDHFIPPPDSSPGGGEAGGVARSVPRILIVDDEKMIRWSLVGVLSRPLGIPRDDFLQADTVAAGIQVFDSQTAPVDLVLSDMMMPGGTGIDLYRKVRERSKTVPVLFLSGGMPASSRAELDGILAVDSRSLFLDKPFDVNDLIASVRLLLEIDPPA